MVGWGCKISLIDLQLSGSYTGEVMGSRKAIFEGGIKFADSESRKKFDSTASEDWGSIGERSGSERLSNHWKFMINKKYSKK